MTELYNVLGINVTATQDDVKKAYRKLAKECHPDLNPDDKEREDKFKKISEAYDTLGNVEKRKAYDNRGNMNEMFGNFDPFSFFTNTSNKNRPVCGADLKIKIDLTICEFIYGVDNKMVEFKYGEGCDLCNGTGASERTECEICGGTGSIRDTIKAQGGFHMIQKPCHKCKTAGFIKIKDCDNCNGTGVLTKTKEIGININPNSRPGTMLNLSGIGLPGSNGGPNGNAFIILDILLPTKESISDEQKNILESICNQ